MKICDLEQRY